MKSIYCDICILGGGPTAMLTQVFLNKKGINTCVVAESALGNLKPMQFGDIQINSVPIFLSQNSWLFRKMEYSIQPENCYVSSSHSEMPSDDITEAIKPGSYADFITNNYSDAARRLILTKKHVGTEAFQLDLPGLRRKVVAHYPPGHPPVNRIGFSNGKSIYLSYLEREQYQEPLKGTIRSIDIINRCVTTESFNISFDRLISTIPIIDFLALANIPTTLTTLGAGAQIVLLSSQQNIIPNQLIYDCDISSPLYRAFTSSGSFVIAQVASALWGIDGEAIAKRVQVLFNLANIPTILKRFTIQNCYPLAVSDYALKEQIIQKLDRAGVTQFGRFAEWEYLDLEQLNWERIECLL